VISRISRAGGPLPLRRAQAEVFEDPADGVQMADQGEDAHALAAAVQTSGSTWYTLAISLAQLRGHSRLGGGLVRGG
jgi:hypothetical protein